MKFAAEWLAAVSGGTWDGGEASSNDVSIDSRTLPKGAIYLALKGERFDGHDFAAAGALAGAVGAVVAQDQLVRVRALLGRADYPLLVVTDTLLALQQLGHAHRERLVKTVFVAIAGSNGKTTTKEMVASELAQRGRTYRTTGNLNNHIGVPLSLLRVDEAHAFAVIETGMNHPGELLALGRILTPDHAMITTIQPEHMEGLGSLENVARAEGEIFHTVKSGGTLIFPADEPLALQVALPPRTDTKTLGFGERPDAGVRLARYEIGEHTRATYACALGEIEVRLPQIGKHNALNAAAAAAVGVVLGLSREQIQHGLETTPLVDRRLRIHHTEKWLVLDDCYNANPGSMGAALEVLRVLGQGKRKIAVLGDMLELGEHAPDAHRELGRDAVKAGADMIVALGNFAKLVTDAALSEGFSPEAIAFAPAVAPLLAWLKPRLQKGDVVLVKGSRGMKMERIVEALGVPSEGAH
jgi:UDP-N-acetylmuramoyl-tripeptide--D-alanyl-D-alanine ligase